MTDENPPLVAVAEYIVQTATEAIAHKLGVSTNMARELLKKSLQETDEISE